eukprot:TRINITY_DN62268_c0_g1_i1.p1 TRINITY_DN62268_c0_g1~~TRINITY_DN62268_c0_g1_i1.p1  ORF type:complete len:149 (-),score=8.88 TRINITY_DN62268_c0_g1_i1:497-943(-)
MPPSACLSCSVTSSPGHSCHFLPAQCIIMTNSCLGDRSSHLRIDSNVQEDKGLVHASIFRTLPHHISTMHPSQLLQKRIFQIADELGIHGAWSPTKEYSCNTFKGFMLLQHAACPPCGVTSSKGQPCLSLAAQCEAEYRLAAWPLSSQ